MSQRELTAAGLTSPRVRQAYAACDAYLQRRNSAAFPAIRVLLPPAKRPFWDAALAFCTFVDDLLDDPAWTVERRLARYSAYEQDLYRLMAGEERRPAPRPSDTGEQLAYAFRHFVQTWCIPEHSVRRFMTTIRTDLEVTEYPRYADLTAYIEGVCVQGTLWGNTLLEPQDEQSAARAAGCASFALQLTDYLQDLGEDLADGRLYLPLEELRTFGLSRADLEQAARDRRMTPPLRELVEYQVRRARGYFDEAADWWRLVDPSGRELPRQCVRLGQISLDRIERSEYDIFRVPRRVTLACAAASCAQFTAGYLRKTVAGRARARGRRRTGELITPSVRPAARPAAETDR
ncbi:squalene/phytoene synthase family protein [Streptomyces aurantiacus]|uniref:squalene/phytoene synthase family protein n=1 Tax=Streptomyces aurantiacus TaxID=47760 RepID=UPI0006E2DA16|nr:squalene/phytoene synthase family protein [Streptomyces aurantiacus]